MAILNKRRHRPRAKAPEATGPFLRSMPEGGRLDMPVQDLRTVPPGARQPSSPRMRVRRTVLIGATAALTFGAAAVMAAALAPGGWTVFDAATLVLFLVLFANTAFGFVSGAAGLWATWRARPIRRAGPAPAVSTRTALLMPVYNEDPGRVLAALQAMHEDLARIGAAGLYDIFVLSDTRDEAVARAEAVGVLRLRLRLPDARIYYRRRAQNTERKAGNVADWVARHGGAYDFMLVLDADSIMSADTVVRLTAAMEKDPKLGLLQTAPAIVGAETLFARLQQFAANAYGPMLAAGQDWWSGREGNYWGHNAIIRTRAFAECAGLPSLPGRKPFGGHIMSHDFVEAALLRRGGWTVRLATWLGGSYEEAPPTLLDMAIRDRRWCQGNLQHAGVVGAAGLHWISRLHLVRGILSYAAAPLWLALLLIGAGGWAEQEGAAGAVSAHPAAWVFGLTMALLLAPKAMAGALMLRRRRAGRGRFVAGMALETVLSALIAPTLMIMQSAAVAGVLLGRDAGWNAQQRDGGRFSRRVAWRLHRAHVLIGAAGAGIACLLDPAMFWWTSPVYLGLVLSAPLSALLARPELGEACRRLGLFVTPEERRPPPVVARAAELRARYEAEQPLRRQIEHLFKTPAQVYQPYCDRAYERPARAAA